MEVAQISALAEGARHAIAAVGLLQAFFAAENFIHFRDSRFRDRMLRDRFLMALFMCLANMSQLAMCFSFGSSSLPVVSTATVLLVNLYLFFYVHSLRNAIAGGERTVRIVSWAVAVQMVLLGVHLLILTLTDRNYGFRLVPLEAAEVQNGFMFLVLGANQVEMGPLNQVTSPLMAVTLLGVLGAMTVGRFQGRYTDRLLSFGVFFSVYAFLSELFFSQVYVAYYVPLSFACNLPELLRSVLLNRRKRLTAEVESERRAVSAMVVTLNHELRQPLAVAHMKLQSAMHSLPDPRIQEAFESVKALTAVVDRVSHLRDSNLSKQAYDAPDDGSAPIMMYDLDDEDGTGA